jgi:hypothetical protein
LETTSNSDASSNDAASIVTLVHGTWAADSNLVSDDSSYSRTLKSLLPGSTLVRNFKWSGRNRHSDRLTAAENLRTFLKEGLRDHPTSRHFVIAHSHGGNIVFYALRDKDLADRLSGIITLSTPFIHVTTRDLPYGIRERIESVRCWHVILLFALVALIPSFLPPIVSLVLACFVVLSVLGSLFLAFVLGTSHERLPADFRDFQDLLRLPSIPIDKTLILTSGSDEATGALSVGWFSTWLSTRLIAPILSRFTLLRTSRLLLLTAGAVLLISRGTVLVLGFVSTTNGTLRSVHIASDFIAKSVDHMVLAFIAVFLLTAWSLCQLCWIFSLPFGTDIPLRISALCCISAESTPPGGPWTVLNLSEASTLPYRPVVLTPAQRRAIESLIRDADPSWEITRKVRKAYRRTMAKPYKWELAHSATHEDKHAVEFVSGWMASRIASTRSDHEQ